MTGSVGAIARFLDEAGHLEALLGAPGDDPASIILTSVNVHTGAGRHDVAWCRAPLTSAAEVSAGLLIHAGLPQGVPLPGHAIAVCDAPRLAMAKVLGHFFSELDVDRDPVYAEPALAQTVDLNHSWIRNATIGARVRIAQHVVIGCSGMGYERDAAGRLVRFPQLGGVVIEDDVDVAAHTTIQRGTLGNTLISRGAKIGPHVNVGHNVQVGRDTLLTGHAQLAGSCRIGARVIVWQSAAIANGVTVGDDAIIGMCSSVRADVGPGEVWAGNPARRLR